MWISTWKTRLTLIFLASLSVSTGWSETDKVVDLFDRSHPVTSDRLQTQLDLLGPQLASTSQSKASQASQAYAALSIEENVEHAASPTLRAAAELGYQTLAFNHSLDTFDKLALLNAATTFQIMSDLSSSEEMHSKGPSVLGRSTLWFGFLSTEATDPALQYSIYKSLNGALIGGHFSRSKKLGLILRTAKPFAIEHASLDQLEDYLEVHRRHGSLNSKWLLRILQQIIQPEHPLHTRDAVDLVIEASTGLTNSSTKAELLETLYRGFPDPYYQLVYAYLLGLHQPEDLTWLAEQVNSERFLSLPEITTNRLRKHLIERLNRDDQFTYQLRQSFRKRVQELTKELEDLQAQVRQEGGDRSISLENYRLFGQVTSFVSTRSAQLVRDIGQYSTIAELGNLKVYYDQRLPRQPPTGLWSLKAAEENFNTCPFVFKSTD